MERRNDIERKKEQEAELLERLGESFDENEKKTENPTFNCEICSENCVSGLDLLRHYARTHLANKMKDKFSHLTDRGVCKLCKESIDDDNELFAHIGADHLKLNLIMKDNGLNPVLIEESKVKSEARMKTDDFKDEEISNGKTLEALQKKLGEVKKQMSDSCEENLLVHSIAEFKDLAECKSDTEEDPKLDPKEKNKQSSRKKKKRGRPKKVTEKVQPPRRSSRHKSVSEERTSKVVDVAKYSNLRQRKEVRPSCHKCGQWEVESNNRVYPCR